MHNIPSAVQGERPRAAVMGPSLLATRARSKILSFEPDDIFENPGSLRLALAMSSPITLGKPGVTQ